MGKTIIKYIARFMLEAETPLFVGSGQSTLLKDALVQKDANGFPMISGTTLAGVLRHQFSKHDNTEPTANLFGDSKGGDTGTGSLIKVSPGLMMLNKTQVSEGLLLDEKWDALKAQFEQLPVRQHVRMTDKGVAEKNGLFDNEVIFKGTRFVFELELTDFSDENKDDWEKILKTVGSPDFRIGAGSRNGYGSLKVLQVQKMQFDLKSEMQEYLELSSSFNAIDWSEKNAPKEESVSSSKTHYKLKLTPDPFFIFGSGHGDQDVDNTPVEEEVAVYSETGIEFEKQSLVPGSSIKGALSHRVAYHYNKEKKRWAGTSEAKVGIQNEAVAELFGKAGKKVDDPKAGKVFIDDIFLSQDKVKNDKILNHVAIDRFTGGALEGALFSEKVSYLNDDDALEINLFAEKEIAEEYLEALEEGLKDICKGLLPLGGMTTKGHGIFSGSLYKDGNEIFTY